MRPHFQAVIDDLRLLRRLAEFSPIVIGTPPLGIATEESDIDIACMASDLDMFGDVIRERFGRYAAFSLDHIKSLGEPAVTASFRHAGWMIELFCQRLHVDHQAGVRHFRIERRLLELEPGLRSDILRLKGLGIKTEPAFADVLKLSGDPYLAMLDLETKTDEELRALITKAFQDRPRNRA